MQDFISELKQITEESKKTFGNLSAAQLNWKPNAESWSVGQCFEHLIVTNELYFSNIQKVIDGTHRNNFFSKIPFSTALVGALMKNAVKPDQKRKIKTFKMFEPATSNVSKNIIEDFAENNQRVSAMIESCQDLELSRIKIPEPLSPALNLRLDDAFEILVLHEQRHFQQAERVMQTEGFPKK